MAIVPPSGRSTPRLHHAQDEHKDQILINLILNQTCFNSNTLLKSAQPCQVLCVMRPSCAVHNGTDGD